MSQQPLLMQIILSAIALLGFERVLNRLRARQLGIGIVVVWIFGGIIFLLFVWQPNLATSLSQKLGIGRGVDAAVYVSVAVLFYAILRIFLRLERQENHITTLVSEIALLRNERESKK